MSLCWENCEFHNLVWLFCCEASRGQGNTASCDDLMINTLLSALQLPREGQEFTVHPDLIGVFLPGLIFLWAETCLGHETGRPLVNPESTKTWSVSYIDPSLCSHPANHLTLSLSLSLSLFFFLLPLVLLLKQEIDRTGSILKIGFHLGLDRELWAICPGSLEMT